MFYLGDQRSGTVEILNDGSLNPTPPAQNGETGYDYPRANWAIGVATLDAKGPIRCAKFSPSVAAAGARHRDQPALRTGGASVVDGQDADLIVRLSDAPDGGRANVITKGWLRASLGNLWRNRSRPRAPALDHSREVPIPAMTSSNAACR